jgi:tRNA (guanine37-N1)-methyltransferase
MVMLFEPLFQAIEAAKQKNPAPVIHMSPQGKPLTHEDVVRLSHEPALIILCSRYEGVDQRLLDTAVDDEFSIGDFVVSGGELPALMLMDAVIRLLPGALGHPESAVQDSFSHGLLDHSHYTRPETIHDLTVPFVLKSGDHQAISRFRLKESLGKTWQKRQDLIKRRTLTALEAELLAEFIREHEHTPKKVEE